MHCEKKGPSYSKQKATNPPGGWCPGQNLPGAVMVYTSTMRRPSLFMVDDSVLLWEWSKQVTTCRPVKNYNGLSRSNNFQ